MRIAIVTRSTLHSIPGGDTIQIEQTARWLRLLGAIVDVFPANTRIPYQQYDLLHFFNITRPADFLLHADKSGLPFAVSPNLVDYSEYDRRHRTGIPGRLLK